MRFVHTKCGGEIDVKKRQCTKCKHKWDPISFRLDPTGIRPMVDKKGKPIPDLVHPKQVKVKKKKKQYSSWADSIPGAGRFASILPRWPRWARITATLVFVVIVVVAIILVIT